MPYKRIRSLTIALRSACFVHLLLLGTPAFAQEAVDLQQLDAYIAEAQEDWPVPGLAIAIVDDGEVVFEKGYGIRELGTDEPVDEHTLFAIASNTKAFTAAALAILVDQGTISWDDPVRKYLPWFDLYDPYVSAEMRIRDLLSHRSGLGTFSGDLLWYGTDYSTEEVVRRARFLEPAGPFRATYGYSNLMFLAAGLVVEAVSGQSWDAFVETHILDPLGMDRTVTSVEDLEEVENVATPHKPMPDSLFAIPWYGWDNMAPAGGIISSVDDMARWLQLQLGRGAFDGERIFSEDASYEMWSPHTIIPVSRAGRERFPSIHFRAYGLGWSLMDYLGRKVVSHGGGYDGMYSTTVLVPEEDLGFVILTNSMTGLQSALLYRILNAYLGGEERDWSREYLARDRENRQAFYDRIARIEQERVPNTNPSLPLEAYAGTYGGDLYGEATVTLEDGRLVLRLLPNEDLVADLSHLHYDTFLIDWRQTFAWFDNGTAQFVLGADGKVQEMRLNVPNEDLWFHELEFRRRDGADELVNQ